MPAFFHAIKEQNISLADIKYLVITHYHPDHIFAKDKRVKYVLVDLDNAIIPTPGHSNDSVSLVLDEGIVTAGDLYPIESVPAYQDEVLNKSWRYLLGYGGKTVYYAHAKESNVEEKVIKKFIL